MFKIRKKSKSVLKLDEKTGQVNKEIKKQEVNRYKCLQQISHTEQYWRNLLLNEMEMESLIVAFQNVQISMRVDARKKLMLRETFLLKKQIIKLIINHNFQQVLAKLEFLRSSSAADHGLATIFIYFCSIRKTLITKKLLYDIQTVRDIKQKILNGAQLIQKQKNSIVYGRVLYILALHLIKLNGVLIKIEDVNIVVQALTLKKKQLCMLSEQINQPTLQSLLYLTFEFYRILYLLKRDQDLITQYYNQIRAYISIFKTKCKGYEQFQNNFKIQSKIQKIKPLTLNLKIYTDHERRKIFSLQNTKLDLMKNHYATRNQNILSTQISAQITNRKVKRLGRQNSLESEHQKMELSQKNINEQSTMLVKEIIEMVTQKNKQITQDDIERFNFNFIKPVGLTTLMGTFKSVINLAQNCFKIIITLSNKQQQLGVLILDTNLLQNSKNFGAYAKKLWRIIKQKFYIDKTQFLPNLFSFEYPPRKDLPKNINLTYELPISVRIHQIILHYLRKQVKHKKMNGYIMKFPNPKDQYTKENIQKVQPEQKIFTKRTGFISFNKGSKHLTTKRQANSDQLNFQQRFSQSRISHQLSITLLTKQDDKILLMYVVFVNSIFKRCVTITKQQQQINEKQQINYKYKQITKLILPKWLDWQRKMILKLIKFIEAYQTETQQFFIFPEPTTYSENKYSNKAIQQQFQVMKSPVLQAKTDIIKTYRQKNHNLIKKINNYKKCFKISHLYIWFYQQSHLYFNRYFDSKRSFITCQETKQCDIEYIKFRIYKTIAFKQKKCENQYKIIGCYQTKAQKDYYRLIIKKQKIRVIWKRTSIIKEKGKFYFLNLFKYKQIFIVNLYDFSNLTCYMGNTIENMEELKWAFDTEKMILNKNIKMTKFQTSRNSICDAQQYLKVIQNQLKYINYL